MSNYLGPGSKWPCPWPDGSSNSLGWASNAAWEIWHVSVVSAECFCELPATQLSETLGRAPHAPWAVPSTPCPTPKQYSGLKGSMDVHVWNEILYPQLVFLYPASGLVTWWRCKQLKSTPFAFLFMFWCLYMNEGWIAQILEFELYRAKEVVGVTPVACHRLWPALLLPWLDSVRDLRLLLLFPHPTPLSG